MMERTTRPVKTGAGYFCEFEAMSLEAQRKSTRRDRSKLEILGEVVDNDNGNFPRTLFRRIVSPTGGEHETSDCGICFLGKLRGGGRRPNARHDRSSRAGQR